MATNKRIFYAVKSASIAPLGSNSFTNIHGLQSIGVNTQFNLEQVFEIGQAAIYQNIENIPDIECTMEKVLDGYPLVYHLATYGAPSATLTGRSNTKCSVGMAIFSDQQDSASGTPVARCVMSGMYVNSIAYNIQVQGSATEQVTLVGNNKVWNNSYSITDFDNTDTPSAAEGVNQRQHIQFGASDTTVPSKSLIPTDIPGTTASGTLEADSDGIFPTYLQSIQVSTNLGREALYQLGNRQPYHRYANFPAEVRSEFEVISHQGDNVTAQESATSNTTDQKIYIKMTEGTLIDLGTKNRLASVNSGGANAGTNGGNETATYSYVTYSDFTVQHSADPTVALRP